ncbi:thiamine pyrophosphate-binding protein [Thermogymnomonas acidicola]|nr:thiamine pyrophosphate-binding protein [Thermogymnomonas acidicola]
MARSAASLITETLGNYGVKFVFGVPGDQLYSLMDECLRSGIEFISFRDERSAAHAAGAFSRLTNRLSVVASTVGSGTANLVGGVYPSWADGVPVLIITAQNQTFRPYADRGSMQALDQVALLRGVTKWSAYISNPDALPGSLVRAIHTATSPPFGPVHLDVPSDVLFSRDYTSRPATEFPRYAPSGPSPEQVEAVARVLSAAERPLLHLGRGVVASGAEDLALGLAEFLRIPVTTTMQARGAIPEDHGLCLVPLSYGAIAAQRDADLVISVGCGLNDLDFFGRPPVWGEAGQRWVRVDVDPGSFARGRVADIQVVSDASVFLSSLLSHLRKTGAGEFRWDMGNYKGLEASWTSAMSAGLQRDGRPVHPLQAVAAARASFPRDAVCIVDGGNTAVWAHYLNRVYEKRAFLSSAVGRAGYIGTAVPFAIGAKIARPEKEVFCITGDGAFAYSMSELETARRLGTPFVCVVLNDASWSMMKSAQTTYYSSRYVGVDFGDVDYAGIARSMGCFGVKVDDPGELSRCIAQARESGMPAVVDVRVDPGVTPPDFQTLTEIWLEGCDLSP